MVYEPSGLIMESKTEIWIDQVPIAALKRAFADSGHISTS